jgi:hypothetical protein
MATLQERRLGYHSRAGLEPGTSRFSPLRINHYAARGKLDVNFLPVNALPARRTRSPAAGDGLGPRTVTPGHKSSSVARRGLSSQPHPTIILVKSEIAPPASGGRMQRARFIRLLLSTTVTGRYAHNAGRHSLSGISPAVRGFTAAGPRAESSDSAFIFHPKVVTRVFLSNVTVILS